MDDDLLRALGRHQREDLEVPAPMSEPDGQDSFGWPSEDERDALLDAVFARVDADEAAATSTAPNEAERAEHPPVEHPSVELAPVELAPVIDLSARRRRLVTGLALALAAALVLGLGLASLLGHDRNDAIEVARLPPYATSELRGGPALTRSDERPSALSMAASDQLDWIITPTHAPAHVLELGLLIESGAGEARWITPVPATITDSGVIRIRGRLDQLAPLEPGEHTLTLVIAAQGQLPSDREAARTREDVERVAIQISVT